MLALMCLFLVLGPYGSMGTQPNLAWFVCEMFLDLNKGEGNPLRLAVGVFVRVCLFICLDLRYRLCLLMDSLKLCVDVGSAGISLRLLKPGVKLQHQTLETFFHCRYSLLSSHYVTYVIKLTQPLHNDSLSECDPLGQ